MSANQQPWQDGAALILKERRSFFSPLNASNTEPPFSAQVEKGQIQVSVPAYARVSASNGLAWKTVHDGQSWGREGISSTSKTVALSFDLSTQVRVAAHGREWDIRLQAPALKGSRPSANRLSGREWILLVASVLGHGGLFLALVYLGASNQGAHTEKKNFLAPEKAAPQIKKGGGSGSTGETTYVPFGGMTYSKFLNQLAAKEFAADPAAALLKSVTRLDPSKNGKRAEIGKGIKSNADGIGKGTGSGIGDGSGDSTGDALTGVVARQKFTGQSGGPGHSKQIGDRERALLRAKLRELGGDFEKVYLRLLSADPRLSVSVSYEAKVLPNGFLSVVGFKARGTYQPDSLQKLRAGMSEIIQNAYVGTDFSGIVLRNENVFVK